MRAGLASPRAVMRFEDLAAQRVQAGEEFFGARAPALATLCHRLAERLARGGKLVAAGLSPAARSDARHVAVEFVHPVIVGKRALPALALTGEGEDCAEQVRLLVGEADAVIVFAEPTDRDAGLRTVREAARRGALTIAFAALGAEAELEPPTADAYIRQELVETAYHVLWELVHVFFEHRGLLSGRDARATHDAGASAFLYPFLAEQEDDLERVLEDVRRSVLMKAEEVGALRVQTLSENAPALRAAAEALGECFAAGGKVLALGNGGSATDAMDLVADLRAPGLGQVARPAVDLTSDPAILTAIANDIGTDAIFSRQVIAYGAPGDVLVALSTSGNSSNVIEALAEARRRRLATIAFVGYDGGRIAADALADHVVVTRSEHIPRIQEAQASAYHVLRELAG